MRCDALWNKTTEECAAGERCIAQGRLVVRFEGIQMLVCNYHERALCDELQRKGVPYEVAEGDES